MKRIILLVSVALCAILTLNAQTFTVPDIDYEVYNAKALRAVAELKDAAYSPQSTYYFYYIYAAEAISADSLLNASSGRGLIKSIRICQPTDEDQFASIKRSLIYDENGLIMWSFDGTKADYLVQLVPDMQNLLAAVTAAGLNILFKIEYSDDIYFGIANGRVCVVSLTDNSEVEIVELKDYIRDEGIAESCFHRASLLRRDEFGNFIAPEKALPTFRGGDINKFRKWVFNKFIYPKDCAMANIQGQVLVSFIIDQTGKVTNITILDSPHASFSKEIIRLLNNSPKWTPGLLEGEPVRVKYILPVTLMIKEDYGKDSSFQRDQQGSTLRRIGTPIGIRIEW